jgi:hypothetical protein
MVLLRNAALAKKAMTEITEQHSNLSPTTPQAGAGQEPKAQPNNRKRLLIFLAALDASPVALRRDLHRDEGHKGDYSIQGKLGHIYIDGAGFLLCVTAEDERDRSPRRWTNIKRRLAFCRVTRRRRGGLPAP